MEITLSYNPVDKTYRIYKGQKLITETTMYSVATDTYTVYVNRVYRIMDKIEETFNEMWDLELDVVEGAGE